MKELHNHLKKGEKIEQHVQKQQQKETQKILIGEILQQAGHILFEINKLTGEIRKAEFKTNDVFLLRQLKVILVI